MRTDNLSQTTMSPSAELVSTLNNGLDAKNPFNKLWRGSKDGSIRLQPMPKFEDPYAEREWIKVYIITLRKKRATVH